MEEQGGRGEFIEELMRATPGSPDSSAASTGGGGGTREDRGGGERKGEGGWEAPWGVFPMLWTEGGREPPSQA